MRLEMYHKLLIASLVIIMVGLGLSGMNQNQTNIVQAQPVSFSVFSPAAPTADAVVGTGTPQSCTEAAFDSALAAVQASNDGVITFNCGGPATIIFSDQKYINTQFIAIDGGSEITLSGGNITNLFEVLSGSLELYNITLANGYTPGHGGAIIAGNNTSIYLKNSTIQNSRTGPGFGGGAILSFDTSTTFPSVEIENSVIEFNESGFGAINTVGKLIVRDSIIQGNKAINAGGAFSVGGLTEIYDTKILENESSDAGGGILIGQTASVVISDSQIRGNKGSVGGGIYNGGSLVMVNDAVHDNLALTTSGGGLVNYYGTAIVRRVTFYNNSSGNFGGAIFNDNGNLTIENSTLSENDFRLGSQILGGGALTNYQGDVTINFSTFVDNAGVAAEAIYNEKGAGSFKMENTILVSHPNGDNCGGDTLNNVRYSLIDDESCLYDSGIAVYHDFPFIQDLADNGGPTLTHMISSLSPAIDAGDCLLSPPDQRGVIRPQGNGCDIGAVERRPNEGTVELKVFLPMILR